MTQNNFQVFRKAAERLRKVGWTQNTFKDIDGSQCLVGAVLSASKNYGSRLPEPMVSEVDKILAKYPTYKVLSLYGQFRGAPRQDAIMAWNDVPWRRGSTVVSALESVADGLETEWLRAERVRLTAEIEELRNVVAGLRLKVARIEAENQSLRKRLANMFELRASRSALEDLDAELTEKWAQLQTLEPQR